MFYGRLENSLSILVAKAADSVLKDALKSKKSPFEIEIEIPKDPSHGDLATNAAFRLAKSLSENPVTSARLLSDKISSLLPSSELKDSIVKVEVKGPGFVNFFLSRDYLYGVLLDIKRQLSLFGSSGIGRKEKVQVEFVSANPTGPLTLAHARQAAVGNALAGILEFSGYRVTREYYVNDEGVQMNILGASIRARYLEFCGVKSDFPSDGYKGAYIIDIAKEFKKRYGNRYVKTEDSGPFTNFGYRMIMRDIKKDLKCFNVEFDVWYSQASLRKSGKVDRALNTLKDKGFFYNKDGAVWFKSTQFGDDKDRVVIKSDTSLTYLATDIAYHLDKYKRSFRKVIDIWGPDHHGYIPRIKAVIRALGHDDSAIDVLIVQLASLLRAGQPVSMSTRAGEFVTLREVMDEVGSDVAKFIFLSRKLDSHLDFDLDIAKKESSENPVYYIQYAHARICSIQAYAKKAKKTAFDSKLLSAPEELELLRTLRQFPLVVQLAVKHLEPNGITIYLQDLASQFHNFYNKCRVVGDDAALTAARLILVDCVRITLANGLRLLGISLPKKM